MTAKNETNKASNYYNYDSKSNRHSRNPHIHEDYKFVDWSNPKHLEENEKMWKKPDRNHKGEKIIKKVSTRRSAEMSVLIKQLESEGFVVWGIHLKRTKLAILVLLLCNRLCPEDPYKLYKMAGIQVQEFCKTGKAKLGSLTKYVDYENHCRYSYYCGRPGIPQFSLKFCQNLFNNNTLSEDQKNYGTAPERRELLNSESEEYRSFLSWRDAVINGTIMEQTPFCDIDKVYKVKRPESSRIHAFAKGLEYTPPNSKDYKQGPRRNKPRTPPKTA